jgi:hypothetical protein
MQQRQIVTIQLHSGKTISGIINGLAVEDGSGRHWLVKMNNEEHSYYVRAE